MKIVKAYKCEFCRHGRPYASKSSCETHESRCFYNPVTHSCATCWYLKMGHQLIEKGLSRAFWYCNRQENVADFLTTACKNWKLRKDAA